jgi:hypothetical protein
MEHSMLTSQMHEQSLFRPAKRRIALIPPICIFLLSISSLWGQDGSGNLGGTANGAAGGGGTPSVIVPVDGLDWEFDPQGYLLAVYSTYTHPVVFPDRQGIRKAQIIAEEKAKAAIVRYMKEHVATGRIVEEIDSTSQTASRSQTGEKTTMSKDSFRKMSESVKEFTGSFARGSLSGVTVLEQGYNDKSEEAWVKIGYSMKTKGIAGQMRNDSRELGAGQGGGVRFPEGYVRSKSLPK